MKVRSSKRRVGIIHLSMALSLSKSILNPCSTNIIICIAKTELLQNTKF